MCARIFDQAAHGPVPETEHAAKLARIAQLEADIVRIKTLATQRERDFENNKVNDGSVDLERFIQTNILPMSRADVHGHLYEVNEAFEKLFGYSQEEWISGKVRWDMITPPEYLHMDYAAIEQLKQTGRADPWEKVYVAKDGTRKNILLCVTASEDLNNCFCIITDRTESKRLEAELMESEERFRRLAEAMPDLVWMSTPEGRTTYHNYKFFDYTGIKPEDDDGFTWMAAVHPDDRRGFVEQLEEAKTRGTGFEYEYRFRSRSGDFKWHMCRGLPLKDANGNLLKFFGTCVEIDESKQLEEELRESELRFRTLANAIPQIVWTATLRGEIDFFNQRWFEFTGLNLEQSINQGWQLLIHPDDLPRYIESWKDAVASGDSFELEFRLRRGIGPNSRDRSYRWHLCRAVRLKDTVGGIIRWFGTWTEIEDQKKRR